MTCPTKNLKTPSLPDLEFGDVVGIFGDDFAGGGLDGAGVADLGEAFGGDDF